MRLWVPLLCATLCLASLPSGSTSLLVVGLPATASVINTCRVVADTHSLEGTVDSAAFLDDQGHAGVGPPQAIGQIHVLIWCTKGASVSLIPGAGVHAQAGITACGRKLQATSGDVLPYATALLLLADHGYPANTDPVERCPALANPLTLTSRGIAQPADVALQVTVLPQDVRPGAFSDQLVLNMNF